MSAAKSVVVAAARTEPRQHDPDGPPENSRFGLTPGSQPAFFELRRCDLGNSFSQRYQPIHETIVVCFQARRHVVPNAGSESASRDDQSRVSPFTTSLQAPLSEFDFGRSIRQLEIGFLAKKTRPKVGAVGDVQRRDRAQRQHCRTAAKVTSASHDDGQENLGEYRSTLARLSLGSFEMLKKSNLGPAPERDGLLQIVVLRLSLARQRS